MYRHASRSSNKGIHHVAMDQKKSVNPIMNGKSFSKNVAPGLFVTSVVPASVVMAAAPILIQ